MARKRPVENPPPRSDSSSDEEEEEEEDAVNNEEENDAVKGDQNGAGDEEEEDEDEVGDDDDDEEEKKSSGHKSAEVVDNPSKSDSASDSVNYFAIKPIVSEPKKSIKSDRKTSSNKKGDATATDGCGEAGGSKKGSGTQRLWSEDDEIAILDGMIRYQSEEGADPCADAAAFHEYIKKSIQAEVSKNQLTEKIRRLKKKYQVNVEKGVKGEDPVLSKAHDAKSFELSKKIWRPSANQSGKVGGSSRRVVTLGLPSAKELSLKNPRKRVSNGELKNEAAKSKEVKSELRSEGKSSDDYDDDDDDDVDVDRYDDDGESLGAPLEKYPYLLESLEKYPFLRESLETYPMPRGVKWVMMKNLREFEKSKLMELEGMWKRLKMAQVALFAQKVELVQEQAKLVLQLLRR